MDGDELLDQATELLSMLYVKLAEDDYENEERIPLEKIHEYSLWKVHGVSSLTQFGSHVIITIKIK
jgi:hypothetical protein